MTLKESIKNYKQLELLAHVELDDVIIKVTQELLEMFEAKLNNDLIETQKEAGDTIVNILSASQEVGVSPDAEQISNDLDVSDAQLLLQMKERNQGIQALRKRYSRDRITHEELKTITETFLSHILSYGNVQKSLEEVVHHNTDKFSKRIDAYKPDINLEHYIQEYPDFPAPPVLFKDISPLLQSPEAMKYLAFELAQKAIGADVIAGLDARGFLFGPMVADLLKVPFVMIRKQGKLPGQTQHQEYEKEYGLDSIELQAHAVQTGQKVVLVDDLLATGGTMDAAAKLIEKSGGIVHKVLCVAQINDAFCSDKREAYGLSRYPVESIVHYEK
ncbi:MAG: adenine phosphoribosyltransferase [Candidatus Absconditabacteria bacterium]